MRRTRWTRDEEHRLRQRLAAGEAAVCPRCETPLERRDVPPSEVVSYVRRRVLWVCGLCGGSLVVESPREGADR